MYTYHVLYAKQDVQGLGILARISTSIHADLRRITKTYNVYDKRAEQTGGRNTPNPTRISKIYNEISLQPYNNVA